MVVYYHPHIKICNNNKNCYINLRQLDLRKSTKLWHLLLTEPIMKFNTILTIDREQIFIIKTNNNNNNNNHTIYKNIPFTPPPLCMYLKLHSNSLFSSSPSPGGGGMGYSTVDQKL